MLKKFVFIVAAILMCQSVYAAQDPDFVSSPASAIETAAVPDQPVTLTGILLANLTDMTNKYLMISEGGGVPSDKDQIGFMPGFATSVAFGSNILLPTFSERYIPCRDEEKVTYLRTPIAGAGGGALDVFTLTENIYYDISTNTAFTPYVGGGIGFAVLHTSGSRRYANDWDVAFAYQVATGVAIPIDSRLTLDVGYRYYGTSNAAFSDAKTKTDLSFNGHYAMLGLRIGLW